VKKRVVQTELERMAKQRPALVASRLRRWRLTVQGEPEVEAYFGLPPRTKKRARKGGAKK
jgi:hypothetical protein